MHVLLARVPNVRLKCTPAPSFHIYMYTFTLLKQFQPGVVLSNVTESVLQTSVSAVTFVAIADRKTDSPAVQRHGRIRLTTASKQIRIYECENGGVHFSIQISMYVLVYYITEHCSNITQMKIHIEV